MIDIKLILEEPEKVAQNNKKRGKDIDIAVAQKLAKDRLVHLGDVQGDREGLNVLSEQIGKASKEERDDLITKASEYKEKLKEKELQLADVEKKLEIELRKYPNLLQDDVPEGKDENSNELISTHLKPTEFDFEPKDHLELGEKLGMIDVARASKVSGSRFAYLKGAGVMLEFALLQYTLQELVRGEGFIPIVPPHMISTEAMGAMGYLEHGGEEEIYHLKNDDMVLIGTSEQAIGPMHMDEIFDEESLPRHYVGFSPCYRREAGTYGKDTKGILRVHQFDKIEMFCFVSPETSNKEHDKLLALQERLMQGLKLPYRVMKLCSGDTGSPSSCTYDIETWIPSQKTYRETHSTSNTTDFQTRRLRTRIKREGKNVFAHALNGTAFAVGRTLIAIMENYQQEDGSIIVPEVLRQWVGMDVIKA